MGKSKRISNKQFVGS